jgi:two-component system phosphate regulon sensor histidine kinase PhoR
MNPRVTIAFQEDCGECKIEMPTIGLQVFLNLIANAAEYSDKTKGIVNISLMKKDKHAYLFTVRNNGLTIPKDDQGKIFSKFFRTEEAKALKESGSGLGLFIVKLLCDKLGWTVGFQSPPEGETDGAEFFVVIPATQKK